MNWIERLPEVTGKDLYSQNGEGLILEYIFYHLGSGKLYVDIGAGDGFILSNSKHLKTLGWSGINLDLLTGQKVTRENILSYFSFEPDLVSIDTDGNDYWLLKKILESYRPSVIIAEFNPAFTDSRTIAYNPDHEWAGDDYYGFSFAAGVKLAEKHGYKVIFQIADMNMIMVRNDLIEGLHVPEVTFKQSDYFKKSNRTDWVYV